MHTRANATFAFGADYTPPPQEQYAEEPSIVTALNGGEDVVYWVKGGKVFHRCDSASDVQRDSQDGKIYEGTVAVAQMYSRASLLP